MRFFGKSLTGLALLVVTLGLLGFAATLISGAVRDSMASDGPARTPEEQVFAANVVTIEAAAIAPLTTAFGEVRARRSLEFRAPLAGKVVWLAEGVENGASVLAGQPLVRFDPTEATSALALARTDLQSRQADLAELQAAVVLAEDDLAAATAQAGLRNQALARQQDLLARGAGSDAGVETAALAASGQDQEVVSRRQSLASAKARVAQAEVALARQEITVTDAERALAELEVIAPFAGRLDDISLSLGATVSPNEVLGRLIDPDDLEVLIRLSAAQAANLPDPGATPTPFALFAAGKDLAAGQGMLTRTAAAVAQGESGRVVYGQLASATGVLPGDFVTVQIEEPAIADAARLPATAVGQAGSVLVLGPDDRLEEVPVTVLRRQADEVIILAGALAGREVVAERSPLLGAGIRIKPVRAGQPDVVDAAKAEMVTLTPEKRAELIALVEGNTRMPDDAKARVLEQLQADQVPARVVKRLTDRKGG